MMNKNTEFIKEFDGEIFNELFAVIYGDVKSDRIEITDLKKDSPINKHGSATILLNGKKTFVLWRDGDFNGSEILDYSEKPFAKEKNYVTVYKIVPAIKNRLSIKKHEALKDTDWFKKLERELNYDFHFSPTNKIREHYEGRVSAMSGKIISEQIECD